MKTKGSEKDRLSQMDDGAVSAAPLSIENVTTIPIEKSTCKYSFPITQLDKYVVTCKISGPIRVGDFQKIQKLAQNLDRWWASDSKFFVLVENDDIKIRFKRLEEKSSVKDSLPE